MKTAEGGGPLRILVVDDEKNIRDASERILMRMGFQVLKAERGEEALELIKNQNISIVLLDLKMPGIDGIEVLKKIKQRDDSILIIVITGFATVELAIEAMKQGAYDFIAKPFDTDPLRLIVSRAQENIRLTREAERLERERQRTLIDLGTEQSRIRTILESLPAGIIVTNIEGQVALTNPAFLSMLNIKHSCPPGTRIDSCIDDPDFFHFITEISSGRYREPEKIPSYEISLPENTYLLAKGRPIINAENECLGAVFTISDITALRALDNLKSEFVAEVSHELRSPLSTIHEQLALVIRDLPEEVYTEDLQILSRALEKTHGLISLIGDLLDLSRIEGGSAYQEKKKVRIEEMLRSIVDFLKIKADDRKQILSLSKPDVSIPLLLCDPFAVESIFGNLITNAINYTPEGGKILVELSLENDNIIVSVTDNGFGIEAKHLDKIFDRFYRIKNDRTRSVVGTGLGLPIVKELVTGLNGSISVESKVGEGSVFRVALPVPENGLHKRAAE